MPSEFNCHFYYFIFKSNRYGIDNIHLIDTIQYGLSSIRTTITADKPILNKTDNNALYNYTALLTGFDLIFPIIQ